MKSIAAFAVLALSTSIPLTAQTQVGTAAALQTAIDNGDTSIVLTGNIALTTPINIGTTSSPTIAINGGGFSLTGTSEIFFVQSGNVAISNATLSGTAQGGNGGNGQVGGGGALGAGGAIFVGSTASVSVSGVQFTNNSATGGNGGPALFNQDGQGGGGGLNGGNGGGGSQGSGSGGGGNGGNGGTSSGGGGGGGGGGLNSTGTNANNNSGGNGGGPNGGTGGALNFNGPGGDGTNGGANSGGGGAGAAPMDNPGRGGNGGTNGGGGGGGEGNPGSSFGGNGGAYAGGGGAFGFGGNGGFGGGGGGGITGIGGDGGFGGGGGSGLAGGNGGVGGGSGQGGNGQGSGGAGAGLGGAIFVESGGTLVISGDQSFTGNSVTAGTGFANGAAAGSDLFLMTGATTTFAPGTGNTLNLNGTIADDSSNSLTSGSAAGAAITIGTAGNAGGSVSFNSANTYSGGTTITNGVTLSVGNTTALGLGAVTVNGGTLTVGNNNHVIQISTGYTQTSTGVLGLAVNGIGQAAVADQLQVVGPPAPVVVLNGQLVVNLAGWTFPVGATHSTSTFTLVTTADGYTGHFATFDPLNLENGVLAELTYSTDDVTLDLIQSSGLLTQGLTANQQGALQPINRASAAGSVSPSFAALNAALTSLSVNPSALGSALDQLSPLKFQHFASTTAFNNETFETQMADSYLAGQRSGPRGTFLGGTGQIDSSGLTVNDPNVDPSLAMVHSRLLAWNAPSGMADETASPVLGGVDMKDMKSMQCCAPSTPWNFFVRGNVVLAQGFSQDDIPHFDDNTASVVIGADYRLTPNFLVGLTAGYAHTDVTLDTANSSATVDSYSPGIYAAYSNNGWYANFIGRYSYNSYTDDRAISFLGQTAQGATDGNEGMVDLDGGYDFHSGGWTYGPTAGVQYTHLTVNSYSESGSDANLAVNEDQSDSLRSRVGASVRYAYCTRAVCLTPHLQASWQHEFMDPSRGVTSQFTNFNGGSFVARTPDSSSDSALIDAGLDAQVTQRVTVFGDYLMQAGQDDYFGQSIQAGVKVNF